MQESMYVTQKGIMMKCARDNYLWIYRGFNPYFANCPFCKSSLSIRKNRQDGITGHSKKAKLGVSKLVGLTG